AGRLGGFHWRAYMAANDKRYRDFFEKLDDKTLEQLDDAKNATMSVDDVDWEDLSTHLHYMLVLAMPEDSGGETIVRNVLHAEGGQAWIRLKADYAPNVPGNVVARMRRPMSTLFALNTDAAKEIEKLDLEINKYEKAADEQVSDDIKKGILLGALQNEPDLQKHVFRKLRNVATHLAVSAEVLSALKGDKNTYTDNNKNKFEPKAKGNPSHPRKWRSYCERPNHAKDDCRKFKRENEAKAEAKKKAKDEKKQRRAAAAGQAAGGGALPAGVPPPPGFDGTGQLAQPLTQHAVYATMPASSGSASTASTTPTMPLGARGINGLIAEQDALKPKCIFALSATHLGPRAESAEPSRARRNESGDSAQVSAARGVRGVMIDSGAQITAFPCDMLKSKGYALAKSSVSKLQAIDGAKAQHYGKTDVRLRTGQDVIQISAEAADVEFPAMSTDAITKQGKSVIHSPLGDWIVDRPLSPPTPANAITLMKDRCTCYLEYEEMLDSSAEGKRAARTASIGEQQGEGLYLSAARKTLRAQVPASEDRQQLPTALGPDPSEDATSKAKALARLGQPAEEGGRAHEAHHIPFRPWRSDCVMGRGKDTPHEVSSEPKGDDEYPVVEMDFFFVATDEISKKYPMVNGYVVKVIDFRKLETKERGELPAILNVVDCRSNASGALFGSKHIGDYKSLFVAKLIDSWGHTTAILLTDGENTVVALAEQVKKLRSHSTIARQGPAYSSKSTGRVGASNGAAAGLLRTLRFSLETKLGCKLELSEPNLAFLANAVGWCTARFQPRSRGGSSYKFLFSREHEGEVAEIGEQVWHRISARVAAGQSKFEARFAKGMWVGKSDLGDQHLVVDLQRSLLKVRSGRRMPEEFRWNAELLKQIDVTPWAPVPERVKSAIKKFMYTAEAMKNRHGPTDSCPKCVYGRGQRSEQRRQRFETIAQERLEAKLLEETKGGVAPGTPAMPGPAPQEALEPNERQRVGALAQAPEVVVVAGLSVCELAVCEEDGDREVGPLWDPIPSGFERCEGLCEAHVGRCVFPRDRDGQCACRRCLIGCAKELIPDAEAVASLCALRSNRGAYENTGWSVGPSAAEPTVKVHCDYYTGEPLDELKYQKGKADELQAMAEHGVYSKIRISDCEPGGKHIGGFPIADEKAGEVRWLFVGAEVAHQHREAFFNTDLHEQIYVHPGSELCERGFCWELHKALCGTRLASQLWGENVKATSDDAGGKALKGAPGMFYFPKLCCDGKDATMGVHGDDFIAEGHVATLDQLDDVLRVEYEITSSPPLGPGHPGVARYLKRVCGYVDKLPETLLPGFFWHADPEHAAGIIKFGSKEGAKVVDTPGTNAIGAQLRNATGPMPTAEARKTASAGGLALYLAADRPDIMFSSKTIMQDVSKPNYQMNARLMRLARYLEGHQVLVWCHELQDMPKVLRADGDADWAAPTAVARKSTSGGTIRFGNHTWDCYSASQATQALSSGESEFYALGSIAARGLQMTFFQSEIGIEIKLVLASDSAAARGMAQRHGVGKVRHLELRYLWAQAWLRLQMFELAREGARKMMADILTKYVDKDSMAKHLHELSLRMTGMAMRRVDDEGETLGAGQLRGFPWLLVSLIFVLCLIAYLAGWYVGRRKAASQTAERGPRAAPRGERTQHEDPVEPRQRPPEASSPMPTARRLEEDTESRQEPPEERTAWRSSDYTNEQKYTTREVHRLYETYTVGELRGLLVERNARLMAGYTRKEELVETASETSPMEMQVVAQLTNELKDHGIGAKWQARMLASGRRINKMVATTTEVLDRLQ
ncbi:unnamed protein product, partial [Prorocentrum cordatum]